MFGHYLLALGVTFGLLALFAWGLGNIHVLRTLLLRKCGAGGAQEFKNAAVAERVVLTPTHTFVRLKVDGKDVNIVTHPHGVTVLRERRPAPESAVGPRPKGRKTA